MNIIVTENQINFLRNKSLLSEIEKEFESHKKIHLVRLKIEDNHFNKLNYLQKISESYLEGLFGDNEIIMEGLRLKINKRLINESTFDFNKELDNLHKIILEQLGDYLSSAGNYIWDGTKYIAKQAYQKSGAQQAVNYAADKLKSAANFLKEKGVDWVFENLRSALLSGGGTAVQIALSFTGVGTIVNEIAWGIMTLYDGYKLFFNKAANTIGNLIIDVICLLTAGNLGNTLKGFVNIGGNSIREVLVTFMKSGVGKYIAPVFETLRGGLQILSKYLGDAIKFMTEKMGINWAKKALTYILDFFKKVIADLGSLIGKPLLSTASKALVRAGVTLGTKFETWVFKELAAMTEQQLAKQFNSTITKPVIKAAEKYAEEYLVHKPTSQALEELDKKFGTKLGDAYALYLDSKKMASHSDKISKGITATDTQVDALRGTNTLEKGNRLASNIQKDVKNLGLSSL